MAQANQAVETDLATIMESGSTNTLGYSVVIHNDGSATAEIEGRPNLPPRSQDFPPGTINTTSLRSLLTTIGDVSRIPTGPCVKPASWGTTTEISYAGKTSGDLQSIPEYASAADPALQQADAELLKFVQTTENQLKINVTPQAVSVTELAAISGSTNTYTYQVAINSDGSAKASIKGILNAAVELRDLPIATIDTQRMLSLLKEIGDVSRIPTETTVISYEGKKSGDLESIPQQAPGADKTLLQASENLRGFVRTILKDLNI
jgi:hypothetical protein